MVELAGFFSLEMRGEEKEPARVVFGFFDGGFKEAAANALGAVFSFDNQGVEMGEESESAEIGQADDFIVFLGDQESIGI